MVRRGELLVARIPAARVMTGVLHYYIEARDDGGNLARVQASRSRRTSSTSKPTPSARDRRGPPVLVPRPVLVPTESWTEGHQTMMVRLKWIPTGAAAALITTSIASYFPPGASATC